MYFVSKVSTLEYVKTRQQSGVPIVNFQALQHWIAEMLMQFKQARSMAMLAAAKLASADTDQCRRTVSAAKTRIGHPLKFIDQQAIETRSEMGD